MSTIPITAGKTSSWTEDFGRAWNQFWFQSSDPALVSLLRIGVGLAALLHLGSYTGDLTRWFAVDGLLPQQTVREILGDSLGFRPTYLALPLSATSLWILHGISLTAAAAVTLGLFSRVSCAVTALATLALVHRAPMISGQVEPVLVFMLIYLCIAPAGARFSLDSLLHPLIWPKQIAGPSVLATLSLRLMQVHLAAFYLMMGLSKTYGDAWWDGIAIWHLMAQTHSRPLDLSFLREREYLLNGWTHFIVYVQLAFPVLIWNRYTRPVLLVAAAIVWLSLLPITGLTSFCLLMLVATLCYLSPEAIASFLPARPIPQFPR